jgi:hypothetical protein
MKYMLLIYSDENAWTQREREDCYAESVQLTQQLNANGQYLVNTWALRRCTLLQRQPVSGFMTEKDW